MKKSVLTVVLLVLVKIVSAQYDPKALEILEAMSKKYKAIPAFEANFTSTLTNETEKVNEA